MRRMKCSRGERAVGRLLHTASGCMSVQRGSGRWKVSVLFGRVTPAAAHAYAALLLYHGEQHSEQAAQLLWLKRQSLVLGGTGRLLKVARVAL